MIEVIISEIHTPTFETVKHELALKTEKIIFKHLHYS